VNKTGEDYNLASTAEAALDDAGDITDGTVFTGDWDNQSGSDIADATAVTWDAGSSTGTLIHMTGTQYLIDVTAGTLADNDTVSDGTNTFDINGTPDDVILVIECYDDDGAMTDAFSFNGNTTGANNYCVLRAAVGERHNGTLSTGASGTGFLMKRTTAGDIIKTGGSNGNVRVQWIQFEHTSTGDIIDPYENAYGWHYEIFVSNCILKGGTNGFNGLGKAILKNTIAYGQSNYCFVDGVHDSVAFTGYNLTADASGANYGYGGSKKPSLYNCIGVDAGTDDYVSGCGGDFNLSSDATAPGTNSLINKLSTDQFVGSGDYHLKSGADAIDAGNAIYAYQNPDIDGVVYTGKGTLEFSDDFTGTVIDTSKWTKHRNDANITQDDSLTCAGGSTTSGTDYYGRSVIATDGNYDAFQDGVITGKVYLTTNGIAEVYARWDTTGITSSPYNGTGVPARMDARSGQGISMDDTQKTFSATLNTWSDFSIIFDGDFCKLVFQGYEAVDTSASVTVSGACSLQNHYGDQSEFDDIKAYELEPADIGADEYVAAGGASWTPKIMIF